ncbi:MAG TPA: choice-of-anchor L domain-containing protein [Lentimicrobium sp.]|nr:choice-of-anchor L domain-containing protein [Lentimicrobium sp.]
MSISTIGCGKNLPVFFFSLLLLAGIIIPLKAQIPINYTAAHGIADSVLVRQYLIGQGVVTSNITSSGHINSRGRFIGTSNLGIYSGVILASGDVENSEGPNDVGNAMTQYGFPGDPILTQLANNGLGSEDASVLEFDFIPQSNRVEFRYVFGSEEYPEFVNSSFNDVFGFFISGPGIEGDFPSPPGFPDGAINIALVPNVLIPTYVSINNINDGPNNNGQGSNSMYYVNNGTGNTPNLNPYIQYDGFTTVLTAAADVEPCQTYHIKLVIGDIGDDQYDSGVFLEANSFSSVGLGANVAFTHTEVDTAVEACNSANIAFEMFDVTPVDYDIFLEIGGTAINGTDYELIPNVVTIPAGDTMVVLTINPIEDMIPEDFTETITIRYNSSLCPSSEEYDTITLYVKDLQPFSSSAFPGAVINCEDTLNLWAAGDGGQIPYYYTWSTGETTETIEVSPPNPTQYTVQVADVCGQSETHTIDIDVIGPVAVACDDVSLCIGNSTPLSVEGGTSWLWVATPPDGSLTDPTLQNPVVSPAVTTTYTVTVFDNCGNQDTDEVTVFVGELYADAGSDVTICDGQSTTLTASPTGNLSYTWTENGNPYGTGQEITVSPLTNSTYCVTVTDNACTTLFSTDCVDVGVINMLVTANADVSTICAGDPVTLTATNNPSSGNGIYTWSDGVNTYTGQSVTVYPETTTTYNVIVDDGCVKPGNPVTVTVNPLPPVSATAPVSAICPDDNITLTASGAVSYVWLSADPTLLGQENSISPTVAPLQTTTYYLTGTDGNSCVNTDEITITVKERMFADFVLSIPEVCEGEDITVTYTGNGNIAATYDWDFGGGVPSGTGQGPNQVHWDLAGNKTITLTVTQNACISTQVMQTIEVLPMPVADFTQGITAGCVPLTVDFTDASTNTVAGATYEWDFGTGDTYNVQSPSYEFTQAGTYNVSLTVGNPGCSNTITVPSLIDAWPVPVAGINASPSKVSMKNPVITFSSTSTGDNLSVDWLTGDGGAYDVPEFTHTYADSGTYQVQIIVENGYGCVDSTVETVIVTPRYMLRIPNAFTPNNDGMNDKFTVRGNGVKEYRITIYDKWGKLVWESKDINESWDGKLNGQPPVSGIYLYHTYFKDDNDEVSEQTGSFVIVR